MPCRLGLEALDHCGVRFPRRNSRLSTCPLIVVQNTWNTVPSVMAEAELQHRTAEQPGPTLARGHRHLDVLGCWSKCKLSCSRTKEVNYNEYCLHDERSDNDKANAERGCEHGSGMCVVTLVRGCYSVGSFKKEDEKVTRTVVCSTGKVTTRNRSGDS